MRTWISIATGLVTGLVLWSGVALAETQVKPNKGSMTLRAHDGTTQEFHASKETLQDMKVGEKVEAKLRVPENCKKS